jgi:hypothetical protein
LDRPSFEKEMGMCNLELNKLKSDQQIRQSQAFQSSKITLDQLLKDLITNRQRSRETLGSLRSDLRLEINLERTRQRDTVLQAELKFHDLITRIESEVGNSQAILAKLRHDIFYSLTGFLFTSIAAFLGYLRLIT